jgi:N-acetylmuramoyl-L-alanine amidase
MSRLLKCFMILTGWIFVSFPPSCALAINQITNIRHWVAPDHTRVVIDTVDDALFSVDKGERKIVIDLEETSFPDHISQPILINKPGLEGVAITARDPSGVRVELTLPAQVQTTVFKLKPFQDKPYRIVIDIILPEVAKQESEARERVKITRKDRIIVIDPGHGGEAVGAVGKKGTFEKDVVLSISRKLQAVLNKRPGYRAFLTRDGDYYVAFSKRLMIAREYGADLFVSIHADAARNRTAGGTSVYCLSTGGASSAAAKILARNENLADVVGGVPNGESGDGSDPIILDMFQTNTLNQSKTFGGSVLQHLQKENPLKFTSVQEAPFYVLKLPEIPSVLIETAYISNAKEEKLLKSVGFQMRMAEAIANSITKFLPPLPPVAVSVTVGKEEKNKDQNKATRDGKIGDVITGKGEETSRAADAKTTAKKGRPAPVKVAEGPSVREKTTVYRVQKGDTLEKIARKHETSVGVLLTLNHMKLRDSLYVNRLLKITGVVAEKKENQGLKAPVSEGQNVPAEKKGKVIYRVKKGDTLAVIAKRHGTTVGALAKLNRLKPADPLYIDKKLVISGNPAL